MLYVLFFLLERLAANFTKSMSFAPAFSLMPMQCWFTFEMLGAYMADPNFVFLLEMQVEVKFIANGCFYCAFWVAILTESVIFRGQYWGNSLHYFLNITFQHFFIIVFLKFENCPVVIIFTIGILSFNLLFCHFNLVHNLIFQNSFFYKFAFRKSIPNKWLYLKFFLG